MNPKCFEDFTFYAKLKNLLDMDWQTNRLSYKLTKVLCC
ncbi:hypothetical protein NC99_18100 [Sunxiuqinia dokdonensis]|uniref:Uncharacterized protein n=1 Tax=Sunxiuqinia dokdonensis TaxID=1409788 RepID=A0A0L8VA56_9BACT|nr:hypothetical protein NC99_18100 [Sunxiuqinia dokdonensis]